MANRRGVQPTGGRRKLGERKAQTVRMPMDHFGRYDAEAEREGLEIGDYLTKSLAEAHGLPVPDYIEERQRKALAAREAEQQEMRISA